MTSIQSSSSEAIMVTTLAPKLIVLLAFLSTVSSFSVHQLSSLARHKGRNIRLRYAENHDNDGAGLTHSRHENDPSTTLLYQPPMLELMDLEEDWKEWHYSFSRNGLTDFLPQFSANLNCLMVGGDSTGSSRLPWQEEPQAKITNVPIYGILPSRDVTGSIQLSASQEEETSSSLHQRVSKTTELLVPDHGEGENYDCILDRGLMNTLLSSSISNIGSDVAALEEMHALLHEASQALREHGIFVVVTDHLLTEEAKAYLAAMGEAVGMEWSFDLDGISSDEIQSVSVARKFFTGTVNNDFVKARPLLRP